MTVSVISRARRLVTLGLAALLLRFSLRMWKRARTYARLSKVLPMPKCVSSLIFGYLWQFSSRTDDPLHAKLELFDIAEKEAGKQVDAFLIQVPFWVDATGIVSRSPELTKFILKDEFDSFVKSNMLRSIVSDFLGKGIFYINHGSTTSENVSWVFQRKTAAKIFTRKVFTGHVFNTLCSNVQKLDNLIGKSVFSGCNVVQMKKLMYAFTMDSIGDIGFGVDLNTLGQEVVPFSKAFDEVVYEIRFRSMRPGWKRFPWLYKGEKGIRENIKILNDLTERIIKERKGANLEDKGDILSLFMQADPDLSEQFLRDVIMSFMIAGRDTSACTLTFCFFLLATHPEVQEKLFEEINKSFPKENLDLVPTLEDLKKFEFLDGVVFETLRLFPPVPMDSKQSARPVTLPNGVTVPKGTFITFEPYAMGRNERTYKDAGSFKPERWSELNRNVEEFDQYIFPVFQGGPRICLGKDLALYEVKMVLVELLRRFRFSLPEKNRINDRAAFEKDCAKVDGKAVYQMGLTLTFKDELELVAEER